MKELNLNELSVEQKIGQLFVVRKLTDTTDPTNRDFVYEMMEKRCVGGIQVAFDNCEDEIKEIKSHADYPILICNDMERGFPLSEYTIPSMLALAITGDKELAYQVGAVTAIEAKRHGYNTLWGPVVDYKEGNAHCSIPRILGDNAHDVSELAAEIMRGYIDNGMLASAKHWAGMNIKFDSHVFTVQSPLTEKDIVEKAAQPYVHLMKTVGLNAVMSGHTMFPKIDDKYPCTLSEKMIGILRGLGYDGLIFTDSFAMMGVLQLYGEENCYGLAIKAGNDMVLPNYRTPFKESYEYMLQAYKNGVFSEERLNEAVARVLRAQHFATKPATATEVSDYQKKCFERIGLDSICVIKDDGIKTALAPDKRKLFVIMTENYYLNNSGTPYEISDNSGINSKNIEEVKKNILDKFPGSEIRVMCQYPSTQQTEQVCSAATKVDEVIYITFVTSGAYRVGENLTENAINIIRSMKNKVSAICHLGNPYAMEMVPHVPRLIFGVGGGAATVANMVSALNGEYEPKGVMPLKLKLQ